MNADVNKISEQMSAQINEHFSEPILPEHREKFLHDIGDHLTQVAPRFGNISFNFSDGEYVGFNENSGCKKGVAKGKR